MRRIRLLTYTNAELLDVAGPLEVFAITSECALMLGDAVETPCYEIKLISLSGGVIVTSGGVAMETERADAQAADTLLIPGAHGSCLPGDDQELLAYIRSQSKNVQRIGAIGSGALILAQTGLLSGRRATTHWAYTEELARKYPDVAVMTDSVFVSDGPYWTCAGVLAGIDMAIAMVEADLGRRMADYVARRMVAKSRRTEGETQFSTQLQAQEAEVGRIRRLMEWIADNPSADLSVISLAERAALSRRGLHRHFKRVAQLTPAEFVERARVNEARRLLTKTDQSLERVAAAAGFSSLAAMRRAFARSIGASPAEYRKMRGLDQVGGAI